MRNERNKNDRDAIFYSDEKRLHWNKNRNHWD